MPFIKRLFTTIYSRIDHTVTQIENHDAIIQAALKDTRRALVQAKIHLTKVRADGQKLTEQLNALVIAEQQWKQRAKDMAAKDEITALACVERRRKCMQQIQAIKSAQVQHQAIEMPLVDDINKLEQHLDEISRQRHLMQARQSTANALSNTQNMDWNGGYDINALFERWQIKIAESETTVGKFNAIDPLEKQFLDEEEQDSLHAELQTIIGEQS